MRLILLSLLMLCLSVPGFSQVAKLGAAGNALAKQTAGLGGRNISSKLLKVRYGLTAQSMQVFQQVHTEQVAALLTDASLEHAQRMQLLEKLNNESALALADLNEQMSREYAQWGDLLLRERNPNFLPKKDASIPGLLAVSPRPEQYPNMSPRFFREWAAVIPVFEDLPDEVGGLIGALRKKLVTMELEVVQENQRYLAAKEKVDPLGQYAVNRFYQTQMRRSVRRLLHLSKESAQCVADLVYVLNLYPSFYKDPLTLLAAKLDGGLQTDFTVYLRAKIRVPKASSVRPVIGFNRAQNPSLRGKELTEPK